MKQKGRKDGDGICDHVTNDQALCMAHGHEDEPCIDEEKLKLIKDALKNIPTENGRVFILMCCDGYKADFIAEKLGVSEKVVETMYSEAESAIKSYCKENSHNICDQIFVCN